MSVEGHIKSLQMKKQQLEDKLENVMASPAADDTQIAQIKREKLKIKDQLTQLTGT